MSDPYNPMERQYEFTRSALKLLDTYGFGTAIATKGSLVTRDIDGLIIHPKPFSGGREDYSDNPE